MTPPVPKHLLKKTGRFHNTEREFIRDNIRTLGLRMTARKLRRSEPATKAVALEMGIKIDDSYTSEQIVWQQIESQLRATPEWRMLKVEFTKREMKYFAHRYAKHMAQFKENITCSEQTQLFQLIRFEIYMQRNSAEIKLFLKDKKRLELLLQRFWAKNNGQDIDDAQMQLLRDLENNLAAIRSAENSKASEYIKWQEKHIQLTKDLKANRDQRLAYAESAKDDIVGFIKALQDEEFRKAEGDQLELVKRAIQKEATRLTQEHQYVDGLIDRPIYNSDSAKLDAHLFAHDNLESQENTIKKEDN